MIYVLSLSYTWAMLIKDKKYPQRELNYKGQVIQFKNYVADVSDKFAVELIQTGEYELASGSDSNGTPNTVVFPFNPASWSKQRKLIFDTAIGTDNGYGKSGIMIAEALSDVQDLDLYVLNNGYISSDISTVSPKLKKLVTKDLKRIDCFYIQYWPGFNCRKISQRQILYTMLEATRIPAHWVKAINDNVERCIVPCIAQKQAFIDSGVNVDIEVIPLGLKEQDYQYKEREESEEFIFGLEGTLTFRKGPDLAVEAFQKAFPKDKYPNVGLFIKTRPMKGLPFGKTLEVKDGALVVDGDERIIVVTETWNHETLIKEFYDKINAYLFLSRGEGWSMTTVQAMACGLPTIATDCSGIQDHLNNEVGYLVPTNIVDVPNGMVWDKWMIRPAVDNEEYGLKGVGYPLDLQAENQQWWEADIDEAVKILRHVYENQKEAIAKGKKASKWIRENFTAKHTAEKIVNYLNRKF